MQDTYLQIKEVLQAAWLHRKMGLLAAAVVSVLGIGTVYLLDDVYEATARVYVDTASQLRVLLGDQVVESNVEDQLRYVREALLGRPQLERVARETGLLGLANSNEDIQSYEYSEYEVSSVVDNLSLGIQIVNSSELGPRPGRIDPRRTDATYLIRYPHHDREVALAVVSKLLSIFVEDTIGAKKSSSRASEGFLRRQIGEYKDRLQDAEAALAEFNRENFERLPNLQGGYFQSLQNARDQLDETNQAIALANSRLESIERQIRGEFPRTASQRDLDPNSIEARVLSAQRELDELKLRYTDQHPDVRAAAEILSGLETRLEELYDGSLGLNTSSNNPVFQALQITRNEVQDELATLAAQRNQRQQRVQGLEGLMEEMPEVEAELARLNRDYDVISGRYQELVDSLEKENLSREVRESEEMEFRIIDPPAVGVNPVSPRRGLLTAFAIVFGIGVGLVGAYILSQLNPVVINLSSLRDKYGITVLGEIALVQSETSPTVRKQEVSSFVLTTALVYALVLFLAAAAVIGAGSKSFL
jgi:protein tyrosine kinase modulator